ncbi:hypothetical protein U9M48_037265 [Paspalum notatum var. saurae]|uniref:Uncharacterized protein n=1 Tax=Paspalum notatum var. saurae TaxID=547442 RepID=A0AAQ3UJB4_PASNO
MVFVEMSSSGSARHPWKFPGYTEVDGISRNRKKKVFSAKKHFRSTKAWTAYFPRVGSKVTI